MSPTTTPGDGSAVLLSGNPGECRGEGRPGGPAATSPARISIHLQLNPAVAARKNVQEALAVHRQARAEAGHEPGAGRIDLSFPCYVSEDGDAARRVRRQVEELAEWYGDDVTLGLGVHSGQTSRAESEGTLRLFAEQVAPKLFTA